MHDFHIYKVCFRILVKQYNKCIMSLQTNYSLQCHDNPALTSSERLLEKLSVVQSLISSTADVEPESRSMSSEPKYTLLGRLPGVSGFTHTASPVEDT